MASSPRQKLSLVELHPERLKCGIEFEVACGVWVAEGSFNSGTVLSLGMMVWRLFGSICPLKVRSWIGNGLIAKVVALICRQLSL